MTNLAPPGYQTILIYGPAKIVAVTGKNECRCSALSGLFRTPLHALLRWIGGKGDKIDEITLKALLREAVAYNNKDSV